MLGKLFSTPVLRKYSCLCLLFPVHFLDLSQSQAGITPIAILNFADGGSSVSLPRPGSTPLSITELF